MTDVTSPFDDPPLFDIDLPGDPGIKFTESAILDLLAARFLREMSMGSRYVFARQVDNRTGGRMTRRFDAVAMELWPSDGLRIHAFEVKTSRADWRRELSVPGKGADALRAADTLSVVAPAGIVRPDELPDGWGWYEVTQVAGTPRLRRRRMPAAASRPGPHVDREFVASMLRATFKEGGRGAGR